MFVLLIDTWVSTHNRHSRSFRSSGCTIACPGLLFISFFNIFVENTIRKNILSKECSCIFPNQLFLNNPAIQLQRSIYLIEDHLFFSYQKYHAQRLVQLRAALKQYESFLKNQGYTTRYLEHNVVKKRGVFLSIIKHEGFRVLHVVDPVDYYLMQDLSSDPTITLKIYNTPQFLLNKQELPALFSQNEKWKMSSFYIQQRKKYSILVKNKKPQGGKWSYDAENRKKIPKNLSLPLLKPFKQNETLQKAKAYVNRHFPNSYGKVDLLHYPTTHESAKKWLKAFCRQRLSFFGPYQDAILQKETFLFHSVLSPLLNTGLLTPHEVIDEVLQTNQKYNLPLSSLEGFIRQVIGWREYMRAAYEIRGCAQRSKNFFHHKRKIPPSFWNASTGIEPIDITLEKVLKTGYAHHIERLMLFGNFMFLCEFDPDDVYTWFMSLFVDAYDWVMVPNVYGMSQFADGGTIVTKPYFSSSHYILKMSDFKKGEWCEIWDGLFWRFLKKHKKYCEKNYRLAFLTKQLVTKRRNLEPKIKLAEKYLSSL